MAILNSVISWIMKKRIHQIEFFMKYPHEVQNEWLMKLVAAARQTEWGVAYDYQSILTADEFSKRVPLNDYDSLKPFIEKVMKGEENVLWPSDVRWFAKSSGTTSDKSKFIPVTPESLEECHYKGGKDMVSFYCNNYPDSQLFSGRGLALCGSHKINEINSEMYYGDLSAIILENLPFWAEFIRVPQKSIALMDEWESKIDMMARATLNHNVTNISGVPSWTLLLLKRILEITGKDNISEVWNNLELFIHGGVSFDPYREQFRKLIPSPSMHYLETYNASEGFFGIQDRTDSQDMLLMLDYGIYYEFIPMDEFDNANSRTIPLHQVKENVNYAMVISTNSGLWRYIIGDTIMFKSLNPYRIRITGRTRSFINAFGEELIIDNAEQALLIACQKSAAVITEYTAAPVFFSDDQKAAHQWLIEFDKEPENLEYFTEVLDNALKSINSDYEAKRYRDLLLQKPIIQSLPKGTFYQWLKKNGKLGGQNKVPRLSNNRILLEQILDLINPANDES
ncbi:MAG: GH3 auxin-responsive promoter family protein [Bacteroidota bacterium]